MVYVKGVWVDEEDGGTKALSADNLNHMEDGIEAAHSPTGTTASQVVESSRVAGDTYDRYQRRADGGISVGPGDEALKTGAVWNIVMGDGDTRDAINIWLASGGTPGQIQIFDYLGAPIFVIPAAGGPAVLGDNFRVFAGGEVFNHEISLRLDGTVQARRGDPGGGVGVFALGAATTAPTRNPDGSVDLAGSDTIAGAVAWSDSAGRVHVRRASGPIDLIGGNLPAGSHHPKVGEYLSPPWVGSAGTLTPTDGQMVLVPIDVTEVGAVYNQAAVRVVGAGVGGTPRCRFGLYADDGTGAAPTGNPLQDWGQTTAQLTANTESGVTLTNFSPPYLGRFWLAVVYQPTGTVTTAPTYAISGGQSLPTTNLDLTFPIRALVQSGVTGALPAIGTLTKSGGGFSAGLRRSA